MASQPLFICNSCETRQERFFDNDRELDYAVVLCHDCRAVLFELIAEKREAIVESGPAGNLRAERLVDLMEMFRGRRLGDGRITDRHYADGMVITGEEIERAIGEE